MNLRVEVDQITVTYERKLSDGHYGNESAAVTLNARIVALHDAADGTFPYAVSPEEACTHAVDLLQAAAAAALTRLEASANEDVRVNAMTDAEREAYYAARQREAEAQQRARREKDRARREQESERLRKIGEVRARFLEQEQQIERDYRAAVAEATEAREARQREHEAAVQAALIAELGEEAPIVDADDTPF
jgi:hypothetical protein